MRVEFYGLTFDLPAGWVDIASDLPEGSPPTLAKETDGCGAIQFSIAKYRRGEKPNVDLNVLRTFMIQFCHNNSIDVGHITSIESDGIISVGVLSETVDQLTSAWYLSNGNDVVFMTYVGMANDTDCLKELGVAKAIVSSISFRDFDIGRNYGNYDNSALFRRDNAGNSSDRHQKVAGEKPVSSRRSFRRSRLAS